MQGKKIMSRIKNRSDKKKISAEKTALQRRFEKRSQSVLDKIYDIREERPKAYGMGKSIFEQNTMDEFGIKQFQVTSGDHLIEILPINFSPDIPYFKETMVHRKVGHAQNQFICPNKFLGQNCYCCEEQKKRLRKKRYVTREITKLYPSDRIIYLI
jgi:hypothetical protein